MFMLRFSGTRLNFELFGVKQMLAQSTVLWTYGDCLTLNYVGKILRKGKKTFGSPTFQEISINNIIKRCLE